MQELGFPSFRDEKPLLHSFLNPNSKPPNFLLRSFSMNSPFIMSSTFDSFYTSAPTSPCRLLFSQNSNPDICFYSVPNSPAKRIFKSSSCPSDDTTSVTPDTTYDDKSSNVDDFEFETSRRFNVDKLKMGDCFNADEFQTSHDEKKEQKKKCHRRHHESLPTMAFADELFCEGKVMPLNPPPSQLYSSSFNSNNNNTLSPGNPNARFKIPFTRSLWNDDFDPFMVALETVKEEKREGNHRRARSMLPLRSCTSFDQEEMHENCLHSSPLISSPIRLVEPNGPTVDNSGPGKSLIRLTEPKGVMFARRARMVKLGYNYEKPITIQSPDPIVLQQVGENVGGPSLREGRRRGNNKWQKMLSFSLKGASDEKTEKDQSVEFARSKLRKLSFRSKKLVEEKKELQVAKMTLVRYRPKLLLCLGYGAKYA